VGDRSQEHALSSAQAAIARPPSLRCRAARSSGFAGRRAESYRGRSLHPTLKKRLTLLEGEKAAAAARLARSQSKLVLRLHPNPPVLYQRKVQQLTAALNEPDTAVEAGEIIRGLIDRIVRTSSNGILKAELYGDLAAIMSHAQGELGRNGNVPGAAKPRTLLSLVAGVGFEPTTFRL
jgi:site-specific DNA recombinase